MPWTSENATEHTKKAKTPAQKKKWAAVANSALKTYKGNEGKAIATANAAMDSAFWDGRNFDQKKFDDAHPAPVQRVWPEYRGKYLDAIYDADMSEEERASLAKKGKAMPGGGYPIRNEEDLKKAIEAFGRAKDPAAAKAWIIKRAKALKLTNLIPSKWTDDDTDMDDSNSIIGEAIIAEGSANAKVQLGDAAIIRDTNKVINNDRPILISDDANFDPECAQEAITARGNQDTHSKKADDFQAQMDAHGNHPIGTTGFDKQVALAKAANRQNLASRQWGMVADHYEEGNKSAGDFEKQYGNYLSDRANQVAKESDNPKSCYGNVMFDSRTTDLATLQASVKKLDSVVNDNGLTLANYIRSKDGAGDDVNKAVETYRNDATKLQDYLEWVSKGLFEKAVADDDKGGRQPLVRDSAAPKVTWMQFTDKVNLKDAGVTYSKDGYMSATPRCARTGIQLYTGYECGLPNTPFVRVYRPPEEVFSKDALASFTHRPVTLDHPTVDVNAKNWKELAVGHTGDEILRDGETFRVPMALMDGAAIKAFEDGTNQLSWGYDCKLDWTAGTTPQGDAYDAVQRNLRANHLAVVASARGGSQLRIGDSNRSVHQREVSDMTLKTLTLDGFEINVDPQSSSIITKIFQDQQKKIDQYKLDAKKREEEDDEDEAEDKKKDAALKAAQDATKERDAKIVALESVLKEKDAAIEAMKVEVKSAKDAASPEALDAMVVSRLDAIKKARSILGDRAALDGKSVSEIRRQVVETKLGDKSKGFTDAQVEAAFAVMDSYNPHNSRTQIEVARDAFAGRPGGGYHALSDARAEALTQYETDLANAWQKTPGTA